MPAAWWILQRSSFGLEVRAVGENPEAADAAGVNVARTRYLALMIGGALMAVGGAFITLALLGSFTLDIIAGRGWVCVALVIFGRWRIGRGVLGALIFSLVYSLQFRLRILPGFGDLPFEVLLALPYLVVIAALAISGRNVAYPAPTSSPIAGAEPQPTKDRPMEPSATTTTSPIDQARIGRDEGGVPIGGARRRRRHRPRRRPQPAGPGGQRHPPRRDRCPRERRPAAGVGLPARHDVHDPVAVRHVHRRHPAVRHPAGVHGREPHVRGRRGPPARREASRS